MSVPSIRRVVVGVDGTAESEAALRWACREAGLRGAEVHAVHAWEAPCYALANYAAPSQVSPPKDADFEAFWSEVLSDDLPDVPVRTEVASGLAARVLLQRCQGADMLVLGTAGDQAGP
ncbi:MAG: universal stress protein, partial [Nocardiopsaceae bacterium]|nr:universal stress protein [Nocardiopsaceae bacterium]